MRPWKAPFLDLQVQVDEMFEELIYRRWAVANPTQWRPPLDLHETQDAYSVEIDLPDVAPDQVQIELTEHKLTINGQRGATPLEGLISSRRERVCGQFRRTLELPEAVAPERALAHCHHGTYRIRLPKRRRAEDSSSAPSEGGDRPMAAIRVSVL